MEKGILDAGLAGRLWELLEASAVDTLGVHVTHFILPGRVHGQRRHEPVRDHGMEVVLMEAVWQYCSCLRLYGPLPAGLPVQARFTHSGRGHRHLCRKTWEFGPSSGDSCQAWG